MPQFDLAIVDIAPFTAGDALDPIGRSPRPLAFPGASAAPNDRSTEALVFSAPHRDEAGKARPNFWPDQPERVCEI